MTSPYPENNSPGQPIPAYQIAERVFDGLLFQVIIPADDCQTVRDGTIEELVTQARVRVTRAP